MIAMAAAIPVRKISKVMAKIHIYATRPAYFEETKGSRERGRQGIPLYIALSRLPCSRARLS